MAIPEVHPDAGGMGLVTDVVLTLGSQFPRLMGALPRLRVATLRFPADGFSVSVHGPDGEVVAGAERVPLEWQLYHHVFMLDRAGTGFLAGAEIAWIKHVTVLRRPDALTITLTMGSPLRGPER